MNSNIEKIAAAFITEMAHKYALPELLSARRLPISESEAMSKRYAEDGMFAIVEAQPTGQLSAIVRSMTVTVIVQVDPFAKNLYQGMIKFSYEHHSRGSNGSDTDFIIAVKKKFRLRGNISRRNRKECLRDCPPTSSLLRTRSKEIK